MTQLSVSNYHALTTERFLKPQENIATLFDQVDYVKILFSRGIKRTRIFGELPWTRIGDTPRPDWAVMPYVRTPIGWDFNQPNQVWIDRLEAIAREAKKPGVNAQIMLCAMSQGPTYGWPFFIKMGYGSEHRNYYERADFPQFAPAYARLKNYWGLIHQVTKKFPARFPILEPYNEHSSNSWLDELNAFENATHGRPLQLNVPNPLYLQSAEVDVKMKLYTRLLDGLAGFTSGARLSFHGIYTDNGVNRLAQMLRLYGIPVGKCTISTDGATPWEGRYTEDYHPGHYLQRINCNKTAANRQAVFVGHRKIVIVGFDEGFAEVDVQDLGKWLQTLEYKSQFIADFHGELVEGAA